MARDSHPKILLMAKVKKNWCPAEALPSATSGSQPGSDRNWAHLWPDHTAPSHQAVERSMLLRSEGSRLAVPVTPSRGENATGGIRKVQVNLDDWEIDRLYQ